MIEMGVDSVRVSTMNSQRVVVLKETGGDKSLPIWIGPAEADAIAVKLRGITVPRPLAYDLLYSMVKIITTVGGKLSRIVVNDLQDDTFYSKIVLDFGGEGLPTELTLHPDATPYRPRKTPNIEGLQLSFVWGGDRHKVTAVKEWQGQSERSLEVRDDDGSVFKLYYNEARDHWAITEVSIDCRPSDAIALALRARLPIHVTEGVLQEAGIIFDPQADKPVPDS